MKKKTIKLIFAAMAVTALWSGCKKDKDLVPVPQPVVNEPEVFTTMKLKFVDSSNVSNIKYATFRDPDADGGGGYDIFDTIKLAPNKTWITTILLLNEIASPIDTVSNEVLEEGVDHLFCFTPTGSSATVKRTDIDANGRQIGLQSKWRTSTLGNGTMQVELRHQPGVKDGTCSPGVTDISINFITKIQ
ncbi:MAG: hypothetical protein H0U95_13995 [Bacteroidetes bacterium]|nr:hypothetical protein [Bacteroidota bacterium]